MVKAFLLIWLLTHYLMANIFHLKEIRPGLMHGVILLDINSVCSQILMIKTISTPCLSGGIHSLIVSLMHFLLTLATHQQQFENECMLTLIPYQAGLLEVSFSTQHNLVDGTLGGMIALVPQFDRVLRVAFNTIDGCSNDPLCSEVEFGAGKYN